MLIPIPIIIQFHYSYFSNLIQKEYNNNKNNKKYIINY